MIKVNPGDLNLQTLAGDAAVIVDGSDLPNHLYVFGFGGGEYSYYLDPLISDVQSLAEFLENRGYNVAVGMPYNPEQRPAVAISKETRRDRIEEATDLCVLVLMYINGRISIP